MRKPTPGPWTAGPAHRVTITGCFVTHHENEPVNAWRVVARFKSGSRDLTHVVQIAEVHKTINRQHECEANARLIAAAPDLLEALISAMAVEVGAKTSFYMAEAWKNGAPLPENIEWSRWFLAARAAIAKAKGEEKT